MGPRNNTRALLPALIAAGYAPEEAGALLGLKPRSVHQVTKRAALRMDARTVGPVALRALVASGIAPYAAGTLLGYSRGSVHKLLHRAGVRRRGAKE